MTAHHFFSRSLVAFSIFTLATGVALIAAPSAARAETGNQIIMSDGNIDCPPCRWFRINDQDGLSFRNLTGEVQNGGEIVISAQVTFTGTAGKPRTGSVLLSTSMDSADATCEQSLMTRQAGDQACAAISRAFLDAATAAAAPASSTAVPTNPESGIIMRDGGVCDPIRHMGC